MVHAALKRVVTGQDELCTKDSWFYPVNPLKYGTNQQQAHPMARGQAPIARAVDANVALTARQG